MFLLDASGNVICTGALSTSFSQWMGNHPVAKWAFIYIAADAAVNAAALAVIGFAGEAIAAAVATEVTVDVWAGYEAADIVVEETDEDGACEFKRAWDLYARNPTTFSVDSNPASYVDSNCSATF